MKIQGAEAVLALSSRSWLSYMYQGRFHLTPLSYEMLEHASGFASEQCPEGVVAISANTLRIIALEKLGAVFNQEIRPLKYTPRKFAIDTDQNLLFVIQTDHMSFTDEVKQQRKQQMAQQMIQDAAPDVKQLAMEMANAFIETKLPEQTFGEPKAAPGTWASAIHIMDVGGGVANKEAASAIRGIVELDQNEAAFSVNIVKFSSRSADQSFLLVGVAKDLQLNPRKCAGGGFIYTYEITENAERPLELLHKTPIEDVPGCIVPFQGRVIITVGRLIRIYDIGKKKLLRKCENKQLPNHIVQVQTMGSRFYVCDVQESCFLMRYKYEENQIIVFADDTLPRFVTALAVLDYHTISVADKFGNIVIVIFHILYFIDIQLNLLYIYSYACRLMQATKST